MAIRKVKLVKFRIKIANVTKDVNGAKVHLQCALDLCVHSLEIYGAVGSSGREDDKNEVQKKIKSLNVQLTQL